MIRVLVRVVLALAVLAFVGVRVFRPTEVLSAGSISAAEDVPVGATGRTALPPLLVDGRLRVFASRRQVKADGPVSLVTTHTPAWSFRRWPQQLSGVVAVGTTVVSRWSDGLVVAIDGRTGRELWRVRGPAAGGFTDSKTAVWSPPGLFADGADVLIRSGGRVRALAAATGAQVCADCTGRTLRPAGSTGPVSGAGFTVTEDRRLVVGSVSVPLKVRNEGTGWEVGGWQVAGGYLAIERLKADGSPFNQESVVIASLGS